MIRGLWAKTLTALFSPIAPLPPGPDVPEQLPGQGRFNYCIGTVDLDILGLIGKYRMGPGLFVRTDNVRFHERNDVAIPPYLHKNNRTNLKILS